MPDAFLVLRHFLLVPPDQIHSTSNGTLLGNATHFIVNTVVNKQPVKIIFDWNGISQTFSIDIFRKDNVRIKRIDNIRTNEFYWHRNFDTTNADYPDALVVIADLSNQNKAAHPLNLGKTHALLIFCGRWFTV